MNQRDKIVKHKEFCGENEGDSVKCFENEVRIFVA